MTPPDQQPQTKAAETRGVSEPPGDGPGAVGDLADRLFRHESARLRASLVRILGTRRRDLAEDVVQDTLLTAMHHWRFGGVPENPAAWITRVARRKALDVVRRDRRHAAAEEGLRAWAAAHADAAAGDAESSDDPIRLMFMCSHPVLSEQDRVLLTLALVAGFGVPELARAFLISPAAAKQRLVRTKRTLRDSGASMELPEAPHAGGIDRAAVDDGIVARVGAALDTLYLMLNEGYAAHAGDRLVRRELIDETRRLLDLMLRSPMVPDGCGPDVHALSALASFLAARLDARTDETGGLVLMEDQDRARWDRREIARGFWHLARSTRAERLNAHGIEAAIAACHAAARTFDDTDWTSIVSLYDLLARVKPTPIVRLNRAAAVAMRDGPDAGLAALDSIPVGGLSDRYHLVEATRGAILLRAGRHADAASAFRAAIALPCSDPERALLRTRLDEAERSMDRA